jgi:hypothetical protein
LPRAEDRLVHQFPSVCPSILAIGNEAACAA